MESIHKTQRTHTESNRWRSRVRENQIDSKRQRVSDTARCRAKMENKSQRKQIENNRWRLREQTSRTCVDSKAASIPRSRKRTIDNTNIHLQDILQHTEQHAERCIINPHVIRQISVHLSLGRILVPGKHKVLGIAVCHGRSILRILANNANNSPALHPIFLHLRVGVKNLA